MNGFCILNLYFAILQILIFKNFIHRFLKQFYLFLYNSFPPPTCFIELVNTPRTTLNIHDENRHYFFAHFQSQRNAVRIFLICEFNPDPQIILFRFLSFHSHKASSFGQCFEVKTDVCLRFLKLSIVSFHALWIPKWLLHSLSPTMASDRTILGFSAADCTEVWNALWYAKKLHRLRVNPAALLGLFSLAYFFRPLPLTVVPSGLNDWRIFYFAFQKFSIGLLSWMELAGLNVALDESVNEWWVDAKA